MKAKVPFYTAIGHSDNLLLADKYCDESFTTPTDFGTQLGQIMSDIKEQQDMHITMNDLTQKTQALKRYQDQQDRLIIEQRQRYRKYLAWSIGVSVILSVCLGLIIWKSVTSS